MPSAAPAALAGNGAQPCLSGRLPHATPARPVCGPSRLPRPRRRLLRHIHPPAAGGLWLRAASR